MPVGPCPPQTLCFLCQLAGPFILAFALWNANSCNMQELWPRNKIIVHVHPLLHVCCQQRAPQQQAEVPRLHRQYNDASKPFISCTAVQMSSQITSAQHHMAYHSSIWTICYYVIKTGDIKEKTCTYSLQNRLWTWLKYWKSVESLGRSKNSGQGTFC